MQTHPAINAHAAAPATIGSRPPAPVREASFSPLMLSDRLLHLAREADHAGMRDAASSLVRLACDVLDAPPGTRPS